MPAFGPVPLNVISRVYCIAVLEPSSVMVQDSNLPAFRPDPETPRLWKTYGRFEADPGVVCPKNSLWTRSFSYPTFLLRNTVYGHSRVKIYSTILPRRKSELPIYRGLILASHRNLHRDRIQSRGSGTQDVACATLPYP